MNRPLEGRIAIVTGANQGLGLRIAQRYAEAGASLAICARDGAKLSAAAHAIRQVMKDGQDLIAREADVSVAEHCESLVAATIARFAQIDILVSNAGVYGPMGPSERVDWAEWMRAVEVNLFGSILMCRAVLPHFKTRCYGKIVQLSGGGATAPLPFISAYATSKAAVVRFVETLAEEVREFRIDANSIAPGALNTRMLDEVLAAGADKVGMAFHQRALSQRATGGAPLEAGADLAVFLGSAASDGITGKLISALWDPWLELPHHVSDLAASDIYTLRRIVPADRGKDWGDKK